MNHLFRFAWLLLSSSFRKPLNNIQQPSRLNMRVWLTDLDPLMHMNNGVYLSLMDLGRFDLMLKAGVFFKAHRAGIYPVIVSEAIRFRKSLKPLRAFAIQSQLVGWDERYLFLRQEFLRGEEVYASAIVKARFLNRKGGKVAPSELFNIVGISNLPETSTDQASQALVALEEQLRD